MRLPIAVCSALLRADVALAIDLNARARCSTPLRRIVPRAAVWLAPVEVLLMLGLALSGGLRAAVRMLAGVAIVYLASEALGSAWPRQRPFSSLDQVHGLAPHTPGRSFPSRHVASGLAMAAIVRGGRPRLAGLMTSVAWVLAVSRVAAGLHYPSDALGGWLLGVSVGRLVGRA